MATHTTARTLYATTPNGLTIAYRRLGPAHGGGIPLLMHIHYRANMDFWDPLLIDSLDPRDASSFSSTNPAPAAAAAAAKRRSPPPSRAGPTTSSPSSTRWG